MFRRETLLWFFAGILLVSGAGMLYPDVLVWTIAISFASIAVLLWRKSPVAHFAPRSKTFREMEKIRKKREKIAINKHDHINDQIDYIESQWGYTKEQKRIIGRFLQQRAYTQIYNKISASLLPQLIVLVDQCNKRERRGCKREVSSRIRGLVLLMKDELKRKKRQNQENFEVTLEVYDHLLAERKQLSSGRELESSG